MDTKAKVQKNMMIAREGGKAGQMGVTWVDALLSFLAFENLQLISG